MPIADIIKLNRTRMTSQQLADLALFEDQQARAARKVGDYPRASAHDAECIKLCNLIGVEN